jgi:hypothetical protein
MVIRDILLTEWNKRLSEKQQMLEKILDETTKLEKLRDETNKQLEDMDKKLEQIIEKEKKIYGGKKAIIQFEDKTFDLVNINDLEIAKDLDVIKNIVLD